MDSATIQAVSADENPPDTREIPLEVLGASPEVLRWVTTIVESTEEQSRVKVAAFNSGL